MVEATPGLTGMRELCTWLQAVLILYSSLFGDSESKCWFVRLMKNSVCARVHVQVYR